MQSYDWQSLFNRLHERGLDRDLTHKQIQKEVRRYSMAVAVCYTSEKISKPGSIYATASRTVRKVSMRYIGDEGCREEGMETNAVKAMKG